MLNAKKERATMLTDFDRYPAAIKDFTAAHSG